MDDLLSVDKAALGKPRSTELKSSTRSSTGCPDKLRRELSKLRSRIESL